MNEQEDAEEVYWYLLETKKAIYDEWCNSNMLEEDYMKLVKPLNQAIEHSLFENIKQFNSCVYLGIRNRCNHGTNSNQPCKYKNPNNCHDAD